MKRIIFFSTNRVHLARQKILLDELGKDFEVDILDYRSEHSDMLNVVADYVNAFRKHIKADLAIVRGDRYELLPLAMMCAYKRIPIAHIEGGELSGAIDNKVRHAITQLSDIHFAISEEGQRRIIGMGIAPSKVFNFGSLDVEYTAHIEMKPHKAEPYIVVVFHPIAGENPKEIEKALEHWKGKVIYIKSNKDEGVQYGTEEYEPEKYIFLIAYASCLVGNSSSFLKEASVFGTPVVNVGNRQKNRLKPHNVFDCPEVEAKKIENSVNYQLSHGRYNVDLLYYKPDTSKNIAKEIKNFL